MKKQINRVMSRLQKELMKEGSLVESSVELAIDSVSKKDKTTVEFLVKLNDNVNKREIEIEESCLQIIAMHQPVAIDLRTLSSVMKINSNLERISSHALSISSDVAKMTDGFDIPYDFSDMSTSTLYMLKQALTTLIEFDSEEAKNICAMDDKVDDMKLDALKTVASLMSQHIGNTNDMLLVVGIAGRLERIADLSTNIAEAIVYVNEGKIIRHGMYKGSVLAD